MEVEPFTVQEPASFSDADWDDPLDVRCWQAILLAIEERAEVLHADRGVWISLLLQKVAWSALTRTFPTPFMPDPNIAERIAAVIDSFLPFFISNQNLAEHSAFPRLLNGELVSHELESILNRMTFSEERTANDTLFNQYSYRNYPGKGSPFSAWTDWLKACRDALKHLTAYLPANYPRHVWKVEAETSRSRHDFDPYWTGDMNQADFNGSEDLCKTHISRCLSLMENVLTSGTPQTFSCFSSQWDGWDTETWTSPSGTEAKGGPSLLSAIITVETVETSFSQVDYPNGHVNCFGSALLRQVSINFSENTCQRFDVSTSSVDGTPDPDGLVPSEITYFRNDGEETSNPSFWWNLWTFSPVLYVRTDVTGSSPNTTQTSGFQCLSTFPVVLGQLTSIPWPTTGTFTVRHIFFPVVNFAVPGGFRFQ